MKTLTAFLRSLLLTSTFSFAAPIVLIGFTFIGLSLIGCVPVIEPLGQVGSGQIVTFLTVFGNGDALEGALVIGLTCGLVGALFDAYAFYQQHKPHGS